LLNKINVLFDLINYYITTSLGLRVIMIRVLSFVCQSLFSLSDFILDRYKKKPIL